MHMIPFYAEKASSIHGSAALRASPQAHHTFGHKLATAASCISTLMSPHFNPPQVQQMGQYPGIKADEGNDHYDHYLKSVSSCGHLLC
jgi:hypothetical protein